MKMMHDAKVKIFLRVSGIRDAKNAKTKYRAPLLTDVNRKNTIGLLQS